MESKSLWDHSVILHLTENFLTLFLAVYKKTVDLETSLKDGLM
jgi:hypothetical protein